MIDFTLENVLVPGLDSEFFVLWLDAVCLEEGFKDTEISIVFCSDEYLLALNKEYLKHDYYTDIITFDYSEVNFLSGDLFISIDRVIDNSVELKCDYNSELKRVCVHGVLHLCGYNDKSIKQTKVMREKEEYYLARYVSRET